MKIKLHYQTYKVVTFDGEQTIEVFGTDSAARRAIKRDGNMIIRDHTGERVVTCDVPEDVIAQYAVKEG